MRTGRRGSTPSALPVPRRDLVAALDRAEQDIAFSWPQFLPDGRHFLFQIVSLDAARTGVYVGDIDTRRSFRLLDSESPAVFAPPRHLLYVQHDMLIAEEFDASTLRLTGRAAVLARDVSPPSLSARQRRLGGRRPHRLPRRRQTAAARLGRSRRRRAQHVADAGRDVQPAGIAGRLAAARDELGDDQSRALAGAACRGRSSSESRPTRSHPLWSPDGAQIAFTARGGFDLLIRSFASADPRRLMSDGAIKILERLVPRRTSHRLHAERRSKPTWISGLSSSTAARAFRSSPLGTTSCKRAFHRTAVGSRTSPTTAASSRSTCNAIPSSTERHQVSVGGGGQPQWRDDQSELFYIAADRALVAVAVRKGEPDSVRRPAPLVPCARRGRSGRRARLLRRSGGRRQFSTRQRVRRRRRHRRSRWSSTGPRRPRSRRHRRRAISIERRARLRRAALVLLTAPTPRWLRQRALAVRRRARDAVAVLAGRRRRPRRALEQAGLAAATARQAVAQRMQADAENRARRKVLNGHAVLGDLRGRAQLDGPGDRARRTHRESRRRAHRSNGERRC